MEILQVTTDTNDASHTPNIPSTSDANGVSSYAELAPTDECTEVIGIFELLVFELFE